MREPEICKVEYCGFQKPQDSDELQFEIFGLETAICEINKRLAILKQSRFLTEVRLRELDDNHNR